MVNITAFFTALLIFFGSVYAAFLPKAPAADTALTLMNMSDNIKKKEPADVIYAVDLSGFSEDEKYSAIGLQGIVAKTNPCIYFLFGGAYNIYLSEAEKSGKQIIRTDENGDKWTYKTLVSQFRGYIADNGCTLYKNSEFAEGLNAATNFASAYGWLPVPASLKAAAEECGLEIKKDLTREEYDIAFQRKYFNELKDHLKKGVVIHEKYIMLGLRDLAIEQGFFCFYTPDEGLGIESSLFMSEVLGWSGKNTEIYGWCENEKNDVRLISKLGGHLIAADYSYNCSYLSQLEAYSRFDNGCAQTYTDETKHYVTLVFSDGDNCQWLQNGYGEYFTLTGSYPADKVSWTFSPTLRSLCPPAFNRTAAAATENTCFISGPSGAGYCNPSLLDSKSLDLFSSQTASAMLKSGERVLTVLDDYEPIKEGRLAWSFDYFSRFENIDGGILFLDPGKYEAGGGKVWFSNDKPFVSVRLSLWAEDGYAGATDDWLKQQADKVNAYPVDIHSIDGYSVICIHAWSMKPEAVNKFISMLDGHIEVLSADDFIKTVKKNIPHKTAAPV